MWRQDHPDVALKTCRATWSPPPLPAWIPTSPWRTPSSSSTAWRPNGPTTRSSTAADVRKEIEGILQEKAYAPWGGLIGEKLVNVLEVNLELHKRYGDPA